MIDGPRWAAIRDRQPHAALWPEERVPEWLRQITPLNRPDAGFLRRLARRRRLARAGDLVRASLAGAVAGDRAGGGVRFASPCSACPAACRPDGPHGIARGLRNRHRGPVLSAASAAFAVPDEARGDRRLERASGLSHQPAGGDGATGRRCRMRQGWRCGARMWRPHPAPIRPAAGGRAPSRAGPPRPHALRGGLAGGLVALIRGGAGSGGPSRLRPARPRCRAHAVPSRHQIQAWITPPAYTGLRAAVPRKPGLHPSRCRPGRTLPPV